MKARIAFASPGKWSLSNRGLSVAIPVVSQWPAKPVTCLFLAARYVKRIKQTRVRLLHCPCGTGCQMINEVKGRAGLGARLVRDSCICYRSSPSCLYSPCVPLVALYSPTSLPLLHRLAVAVLVGRNRVRVLSVGIFF